MLNSVLIKCITVTFNLSINKGPPQLAHNDLMLCTHLLFRILSMF